MSIVRIRAGFVAFAILLYAVSAIGQRLEKPYCSHVAQVVKKGKDPRGRSQSSHNFDVNFYFIDIEASNTTAFIRAKVSMKATVITTTLSQIELELSDKLHVDSFLINHQKVDFTHINNVVTAATSEPLSMGELFTTTIYYTGNGSTNGLFFSGITNFQGVTWTLSEPHNAMDWFACKQVLEDKADSAYIFVTVPDHLKVGSNGVLTDVVALENNMLRFEWKTRYPIAYYLLSMAIAEYDEYTTVADVEGKEIPIQNYVYKGLINRLKPALDEVDEMLELLSDKYGAYPFANEKYGHAMAPLGGGMEHQTMSTMHDFNFNVTAHELGHQWFGDNVTCASWQDIWVNEGFATYTEYVVLENLRTQQAADTYMQYIYQDVLHYGQSGSVYVPRQFDMDEVRIFSGTLSYNKGAAIIHMLRKIVDNDPLFFQALKKYQSDFKNSVAYGSDFRKILEKQSGQNFNNFFNEWYYGEGYPVFDIRWNYVGDTLYLAQHQHTSSPATSFFHLPLDYLIEFDDGTTVKKRLLAPSRHHIFGVYVGQNVKNVSVDPEKWALMKVNLLVKDPTVKPAPVTDAEAGKHDVFEVYPNPSASHIQIVPPTTQKYSYELCHSTGKVVRSGGMAQGQTSVDCRDFAPGIYILRIASALGYTTHKLEILP